MKADKFFLIEVHADAATFRELWLNFIKAPATDEGRKHLAALKEQVQMLSHDAEKNGCVRLGHLTSAFGALLADVMNKASHATPSALQTLAQASDCLQRLLENYEVCAAGPLPTAKVLSVDDDIICNHVVFSALKRINVDAIRVEEPAAAIELLRQDKFDMVLLDVNMPGMTGFEVCEKLRSLPHCKTLPVIFITTDNSFENRKQSVLSGGGDLISKPVSPIELALKVYIHLVKADLQRVQRS